MPDAKLADKPTDVIKEPPYGILPMTGMVGNLVISIASAADTITPWGINPRERDAQLRQFWPTEHYFASALSTTIQQYVAFDYVLNGPPRTTKIMQEMLSRVEMGQGWEALWAKNLIDLFTQDNGCVTELVRTDNDPRAPVISMNHLDARRCIRTGRHEEPILYIDLFGGHHLLKWYQVVHLAEFPAPIEEARGLQYCVLTRVLRAAQIMRDIAVVTNEKAAGRFTRQVHLVGGVQTRIIEDAMAQKQAAADAQGLLRYIQPLIVASLDPTARVSKETIDLASVPLDFKEEDAMQVYITVLAMAFGNDYSNYAPLIGAGMGSSAAQSKNSTMRTRTKGPALFMRMVQRMMNYHGILPDTVRFSYGEQDTAHQMERAELRRARALEREIRVRSGEITTQVARQMAVDDGDLDERYLRMMGETNVTDDVYADPSVPVARLDLLPVKPGLPGPTEPPSPNAQAASGAPGSPARPDNSNDKRNRHPQMNSRRIPGGTPELAGSKP